MKICFPKLRPAWRNGVLLLLAGALLLGGGFLAGARRQTGDFAFWKDLALAPAPETCALCGGAPAHGPCLVNLSTGQVGELRVYAPDPEREGALAAAQPSGYFTFHRCAGLTAVIDGSARTCSVTIPPSRAPLEPAHFCRDCRVLLASVARAGYVMADRHDLDSLWAYPLGPGSYSIRDYTVSLQPGAAPGSYDVTVTGHA